MKITQGQKFRETLLHKYGLTSLISVASQGQTKGRFCMYVDGR